MKPRPRASRPAMSALLLALALPSPAAAALPIPIPLPAVAGGAPSHLVSSPAPMPQTTDGTWRQFDLLQVAYELAWYDPANDQLLSLGGSQHHDWALPLGAPPVWSPLPDPAGSVPSFFLSTVDPATGTVYVGTEGFGLQFSAIDVRTGAVTSLVASNPGPQFLGAVVTYDGPGHRILVVGANPSAYPYPAMEVWSLDLLPTPTWSQWSPAGTTPGPYDLNLGILDPVRRRLVFPTAGQSTLVTLDLDGVPTWSSVPTPGYVGSDPGNGLVYDAATDALWTVDVSGLVSSLSLATDEWTPHFLLTSSPAPRANAGLAIDTRRHRLLLCGGTTSTQSDVHNDVWAFALDGAPEWTEIVHDGFRTPVRGGASDGYDPTRNRLVVFGGANSYGAVVNDTWVLNLGTTPTWEEITTQGGPPPGRYWHSSAWDEQRGQLVVFGGYDGAPMGDCWALSFAGGTPTWSAIVPSSGPTPPARMTSQLVRDPVRDRFLLLGGANATSLLDDVWELKLSPAPVWRQLPTQLLGGARGAEMALYDPVRDRVLVFGGYASNTYVNDLFALNLATDTWQSLVPGNRPPGRTLGLLRYDSTRNRLLLFGGYGVEATGPGYTQINVLNDSWALPLTGTFAWKKLSPAGFAPPARDRANGVYDRFADRLLVTCGGGSGSNDTWSIGFSDAPTATAIALVSSDVSVDRVRLVWFGADAGTPVRVDRRSGDAGWSSLEAAVADGEGYVRVEDRDVTAGASLEYRLAVTRDGVESYFGATLVHVPSRSLALAAHGAAGRVSFTIDLPSTEPASLDLFDLAGRKVWGRDVAGLGTGTHEISAGASFPPALYFARLRQGREVRSVRLALVR